MTMPAAARADRLIVSFHDVIKPDAELLAFVEKITQLHPTAETFKGKAINALFAPRVKTFQRSLDPFQPWNKTDDIASDYLKGAADLMVEQGDLDEGKPAPDYRPEAFRQIVAQLGGGWPFGLMKEMPGAVCAPAEYQVDRKAALAFARRFELDAYSLRFFDEEKRLYARPNLKSEFLGSVPARTLMMFDYDPKAKEPWALYASSDGRKGYLMNDAPVLGLAQYHVCFAKVKGKYKIVALFGYGL